MVFYWCLYYIVHSVFFYILLLNKIPYKQWKELSLEEINDLKKKEDDEKYYQYVKYLNKNYCLSKVELENKLCEKKRIPFSKAKYILDNLENQGVINDKNTIIFRIDDLKMKHFSPQKIKELLVNKYNYSNSLVESIEIELDENGNIKRIYKLPKDE